MKKLLLFFIFFCLAFLVDNVHAAWEDRECVVIPDYGWTVTMRDYTAQAWSVTFGWEEPTGSGPSFSATNGEGTSQIFFGGVTPTTFRYYYWDPTKTSTSWPNGQWLVKDMGSNYWRLYSAQFVTDWLSQGYPVIDASIVPSWAYPNGCKDLQPPADATLGFEPGNDCSSALGE